MNTHGWITYPISDYHSFQSDDPKDMPPRKTDAQDCVSPSSNYALVVTNNESVIFGKITKYDASGKVFMQNAYMADANLYQYTYSRYVNNLMTLASGGIIDQRLTWYKFPDTQLVTEYNMIVYVTADAWMRIMKMINANSPDITAEWGK